MTGWRTENERKGWSQYLIDKEKLVLKQSIYTPLINNALLVMWLDFGFLNSIMTKLLLDIPFFTVG